jgi:hypothetical protein
MLGFILSKMNLLILVVAIAAIIVFFTIGLSDIVLEKESNLLLNRLAKKSFTVSSSPAYCFSDSFYLPRGLNVSGDEFVFVIKADVQEINIDSSDPNSEKINAIIFSLYPRREFVKQYRDPNYVPKAISAASVRTKAKVYMFNEDYAGTYSGNPLILKQPGSSSGDFVVDTEAVPVSKNTFVFLKQKLKGIDYLYIFACDNTVCDAVKDQFSQQLPAEASFNSSDPHGAFSC